MTTIAYDGTTGLPTWPTLPASGVDEVMTLLLLRLRAPLGAYRADATIGLPYADWYRRRPSEEAVAGAVRLMVARDDRLSVRSLRVAVEGSSIDIALEVDVTVDGGTVTAQMTGRLYGVDAVSSWYVTGRTGRL
jgi:hypothetical protein